MLIFKELNLVNITRLTNSVGHGARNAPLDVLVLQRLLLGTTKKYFGKKVLKPDGYYGSKTEEQLKLFQSAALGNKHPSKKVIPDDLTHKALVASLSQNFLKKHKEAALLNQVQVIDYEHFIKIYKKQFPNEQAFNDLKKLLIECVMDPHITDIRWIAYMLATVKRECGRTWKPIKERGKGKGKLYGSVHDVPTTSTVEKNIYYGRGYVQLTWDYNYKKVGDALGLGDKLYINPDLALNHKIAYAIMSYGMREGLFAKAKLGQFISGATSNYIGARRIINGQDHALEIANDAIIFERLLKASRGTFEFEKLLFSTNVALA